MDTSLSNPFNASSYDSYVVDSSIYKLLSLSNIVDNFNKIGKNTLGTNNNTDDLSKLSNEEIREIINRANLEEQYRNIMNRQNAEAYEAVSNTLNTIGSAIAIVGSSLAIAASIKALRAPK